MGLPDNPQREPPISGRQALQAIALTLGLAIASMAVGYLLFGN